ncbi:MAG: DUF421 domain-containing protein, partial [Negativicutes bacterium]|nr:DUF421 domain-containing protein [Negativicutes bacterium]
GRRSLAQLTLYDYVIGLIIGNIGASFAVGRSTSIAEGLVSLTAATAWVLGVNFFTQRNLAARKFVDSEPIIVVYKGRILEENLRKKYYNVNDLLEELRHQGIFDPRDVEAAVIETDGEISVLERNGADKPEGSQVRTADFDADNSKLIGRELIIDGKVIEKTLAESGISREGLDERLTAYGVRVEDVVVAMITPEGKLYIDQKQDAIH